MKSYSITNAEFEAGMDREAARLDKIEIFDRKKSALNAEERNEWIELNHKPGLVTEERRRLNSLTKRMRANA